MPEGLTLSPYGVPSGTRADAGHYTSGVKKGNNAGTLVRDDFAVTVTAGS